MGLMHIDTGNAVFMTSAFWWLVWMYWMRMSSTEKTSQVLASFVVKCYEDNQAVLAIIAKGYSPKLKHFAKFHRINVASITRWHTARSEIASPNSEVRKATNSVFVVDLETALFVSDPHRIIAKASWPSRAIKSDDKTTSRLQARWRSNVAADLERQPQLSWRVIGPHDMSVINVNSDVANQTGSTLVIIGPPSNDVSSKQYSWMESKNNWTVLAFQCRQFLWTKNSQGDFAMMQMPTDDHTTIGWVELLVNEWA